MNQIKESIFACARQNVDFFLPFWFNQNTLLEKKNISKYYFFCQRNFLPTQYKISSTN
jgi:hypothetical protein